ncbi:uncharacterized protein BXZ73DRAFT_76895 [Epithele typhae]|uniref:uncharacterized protein n=1 Tax=Epithele typhae TaxID=378194 RepID=UPI00200789B7|nr:uncharacterized protein BXZ73DRAFT_76895 [Epithele typhae]KAH9935199.1 hypothetical protein BXZ73DRAFT_76895 [Epithele typhae]
MFLDSILSMLASAVPLFFIIFDTPPPWAQSILTFQYRLPHYAPPKTLPEGSLKISQGIVFLNTSASQEWTQDTVTYSDERLGPVVEAFVEIVSCFTPGFATLLGLGIMGLIGSTCFAHDNSVSLDDLPSRYLTLTLPGDQSDDSTAGPSGSEDYASHPWTDPRFENLSDIAEVTEPSDVSATSTPQTRWFSGVGSRVQSSDSSGHMSRSPLLRWSTLRPESKLRSPPTLDSSPLFLHRDQTPEVDSDGSSIGLGFLQLGATPCSPQERETNTAPASEDCCAGSDMLATCGPACGDSASTVEQRLSVSSAPAPAPSRVSVSSTGDETFALSANAISSSASAFAAVSSDPPVVSSYPEGVFTRTSPPPTIDHDEQGRCQGDSDHASSSTVRVAGVFNEAVVSASTPTLQVKSSRRSSWVLVQRTGLVGQHFSLKPEGIEKSLSMINDSARPSRSRRHSSFDRRSMENLAALAAEQYSENIGPRRELREISVELSASLPPLRARLDRDIIDSAVCPPLGDDLQIRRPLSEVGRNRRGVDARPTTHVALERSFAAVVRGRTQSAPQVIPTSPALPPLPSAPRLSEDSRNGKGLAARGRPTYAEVAARSTLTTLPTRRRAFSEKPISTSMMQPRERRAASVHRAPSSSIGRGKAIDNDDSERRRAQSALSRGSLLSVTTNIRLQDLADAARQKRLRQLSASSSSVVSLTSADALEGESSLRIRERSPSSFVPLPLKMPRIPYEDQRVPKFYAFHAQKTLPAPRSSPFPSVSTSPPRIETFTDLDISTQVVEPAIQGDTTVKLNFSGKTAYSPLSPVWKLPGRDVCSVGGFSSFVVSPEGRSASPAPVPAPTQPSLERPRVCLSGGRFDVLQADVQIE